MALPHIGRNSRAKKRYGIYYYKMIGDFSFRHDTSGSTDKLVRAYGNAARHCAMSELEDGEYAQAIVFDRRQGRFLRSYKRGAGGAILTKEYSS